MNARHPFFIRLFGPILGLVITFLIGPVWAGGLSGKGGGSGVACFPSEEIAQKANLWIKANKILPEELLTQAQLQTLESWEQEQINYKIWKAAPGATWEAHLEKVKNMLRDTFPLFMYRVDHTHNWTNLSSWDETEELGLLEDATPIKPIPPHCRRIQLAIRDSSGNNAPGEGPTPNEVQVKIQYVKRYFDKLSPTDQAILVFHEQLYILAQAVGHSDSDIIRAFIRIFFTEPQSEEKASMDQLVRISPIEAELKLQLIRHFGDYPIFFNLSDSLNATPYSSQAHFKTYMAMTKRLRSQTHDCIQEGKVAANECTNVVMNPYRLIPTLTSAETFIYMAMHGLERSSRLFNVDQVLDPSGRNPSVFLESMKRMCGFILYEAKQSSFVVKKAGEYCTEWQQNYKH